MSLPEVLEVGTCDNTNESLLMKGLLPKPQSGSLQTPALTQTFPLGWPGRGGCLLGLHFDTELPQAVCKNKKPKEEICGLDRFDPSLDSVLNSCVTLSRLLNFS